MAMDAEDVTEGWRFVSIDVEGNAVDIGGVNPWRQSWTSTGRRVVVAHPQYPAQRHTLRVYEIPDTDPPVVFAAGEFSNGVWGFFVPA
ncbi:MAG TPA: hypothetical protein VNA14_11995 [Mycobacteriales bacterium]|nr:hypothetical protein [Mycobacteriales bacterium]